jgi:hypothetical protein
LLIFAVIDNNYRFFYQIPEISAADLAGQVLIANKNASLLAVPEIENPTFSFSCGKKLSRSSFIGMGHTS